MPTRRQFLRSTGRAATAGIATLGTTVAVAAASTSRTEHIPDHVTIDYNEQWLSKYQPALVMKKTDREKFLGLYAWRATSTEFDTDVGVYWTSYTHQEGVSSYDSHYGDHEPAYVFVDSESGVIRTVLASVYHWMRGKAPGTALETDGTNPKLRTLSPWHHYTRAGKNEVPFKPDLSKLGDEAGLKGDKTTEFESWNANGLDEDLAPGTVVNPWTMLNREHWWREESLGLPFTNVGLVEYSSTAARVRLWRSLGRGISGALSR